MSQRKSGGRRAKGFYDPSLVGKLSGSCLLFGYGLLKALKRSSKQKQAARQAKIRILDRQIRKYDADARIRSLSISHDFDLLSCYDFECYVAKIFATLGYKYNITPKSGDKGADIILHDENNCETVVQVKQYSHKVGVSAIQEIYSAKDYYFANNAIVVTNNYFTKQATDMAGRLGVRLIDRDELLQMKNNSLALCEAEPVIDPIYKINMRREKLEHISKIILLVLTLIALFCAVVFIPLYVAFENKILLLIGLTGAIMTIIYGLSFIFVWRMYSH